MRCAIDATGESWHGPVQDSGSFVSGGQWRTDIPKYHDQMIVLPHSWLVCMGNVFVKLNIGQCITVGNQDSPIKRTPHTIEPLTVQEVIYAMQVVSRRCNYISGIRYFIRCTGWY